MIQEIIQEELKWLEMRLRAERTGRKIDKLTRRLQGEADERAKKENQKKHLT